MSLKRPLMYLSVSGSALWYYEPLPAHEAYVKVKPAHSLSWPTSSKGGTS